MKTITLTEISDGKFKYILKQPLLVYLAFDKDYEAKSAICGICVYGDTEAEALSEFAMMLAAKHFVGHKAVFDLVSEVRDE